MSHPSFHKINVGPVSRVSDARIAVDFPAGDTAGLALDVAPSPASANERAVIKLGDYTIGQDTSSNGGKNFGVLNAAGALVAELVPATGHALLVSRELFRSNIPLIIAPTGSMANNGVLTSGTANPLTYLKSYTWLPTGAIFAASPAGWYWTVWTTTTAATVYQETWDGASNPVAVASPTAWVKTGPGAFTGPTTNALYFTVPCPALGVNSRLNIYRKSAQTNNANAKTAEIRMTNLAGTVFLTDTLTSFAEVSSEKMIQVEGVADKQLVSGFSFGTTALLRQATALQAEVTSVAFSLAFCASKATATDVVVFDSIQVLLQA